MTPSKKKVLVTGLQPTAGIHLGNYLGAIRSWVTLQEQTESFFFIADLHALTLPQDPKQLRTKALDCVAMLLACGINPKKSHIFLQSQVYGHADLAWILGCMTPIGQLERMTQFKDKASRRGEDFIGAGLLYYPVLMAADILIYGANLVPVGDDQRQHVELARDLAVRFNGLHGNAFPVPEAFFPPNCARVMSLQNPSTKMSKSDPNQSGTVFLSDDEETVRKKIRAAVTDSGKEIRASADKPGMANLLQILSGLGGRKIAELETIYCGSTYGKFKDAVADAAVEAICPIGKKFAGLKDQESTLLEVVREGRKAAQLRADEILAAVREKIGLVAAGI
ncbi:MAG: tryptophan--tRNA ligase [Puniceicoccales bacterium]|jgi:tryptophanyl-tRNA synthetase|nr:tryptophan--tRNA ligase [Puniceicoccales bacterium]